MKFQTIATFKYSHYFALDKFSEFFCKAGIILCRESKRALTEAFSHKEEKKIQLSDNIN